MARAANKVSQVIDHTKIKELRKAVGMNQNAFWGRVGVTQSGGSRYEAGRGMPTPVQELIYLLYVLPPKEAHARLDDLINGDAKLVAQ